LSRYTSMLKLPWRLRAIRVLMATAKWIARPQIAGVKILEHYDMIVEIEQRDNSMKRGTLIVQSFEVCTIRDAETKEMDELLSNSEAIFLGANNQQEWKP